METISTGKLAGEPYFLPSPSSDSGSRLIPDNFVLKEFMRLNPNDSDELIAFQQKYGLIGSVVFDLDGEPKYPIFHALSNNAHTLFSDELSGAKLSGEIKDYRQENGCPLAAIRPVSVKEASECVRNLQSMIDATIEVKNSPDINKLNPAITLAHIFSELASAVMSSKIHLFSLCETVPEGTTLHVSLLEAVVIEHAFSLAADRRFWRCDKCGSYFQYKRRELPPSKTGEGEQRRFCSPECQARAKAKRQNERKKRSSETNPAR